MDFYFPRNEKLIFFIIIFSEYKSKYHKTVEDENLARHKSLSINLASYIEVCSGNGITNRGFQCLLYYRDKYKQFKQHISLYNFALAGFAEQGNLPKIKEVLDVLKTDNIECNAQSYAAIFECLGRMKKCDNTLKLLRDLKVEAEKNVICSILYIQSIVTFVFCRVLHSMT